MSVNKNGEVESNYSFTTSKDSSWREVGLPYSNSMGGSFHQQYYCPLSLTLTISLLAYLVLFTRAPSPPNLSCLQPISFLFFSFLFFSFSFLSSLHPLNSFIHHPLQLFAHPSQLIGNLLVHTLCILLTFCSHRVTWLLHLRHHPNTLCKITATSYPIMTNCS